MVLKNEKDVWPDWKSTDIFLEEFDDLSNEIQAEKVAEYFASTRNMYERVEYCLFPATLKDLSPDALLENLVTPDEIQKVIKGLNKNSACVFWRCAHENNFNVF